MILEMVMQLLVKAQLSGRTFILDVWSTNGTSPLVEFFIGWIAQS